MMEVQLSSSVTQSLGASCVHDEDTKVCISLYIFRLTNNITSMQIAVAEFYGAILQESAIIFLDSTLL